jgi:F-type H+-transporting ATPase subunit epsilon
MAIPPIPASLTLEIVTPERAVAFVEVDEVEIPAEGGYLGVLPGHTPLIASLQVGEMWYRKGVERSYLSLAFGFVEVQPDRVIVLAQVAERAEEIDAARAEAARRRAEDRLNRPPTAADGDLDRARLSMMRALVRLQVASRAKTRA